MVIGVTPSSNLTGEINLSPFIPIVIPCLYHLHPNLASVLKIESVLQISYTT